jgi:hypothetical protein
MMNVTIPGMMVSMVITSLIMKKDTHLLVKYGKKAFGIHLMRYLVEIMRIGIRLSKNGQTLCQELNRVTKPSIHHS